MSDDSQDAPPAAPASPLARDSAEWRVGEEQTTLTNSGRKGLYDLAPLHEAAAKLREIGDARQALEEELFPTPAPPYDPKPPRKAPAIDGWVHCATCGTGQPATGHECVTPEAFSWMREARWQQERAEFAESVLCGAALEHGNLLLVNHGTFDFRRCPVFHGECAFCDAARTGGRP